MGVSENNMPREHNRVFLGNLPKDILIRDIEGFFRDYGKVRNIITKHGKYGFAEFDSFRLAEDAVMDMDGKKLKGSRVSVQLAKGVRSGKESRRAPWVAKYGAPERTKYRLKVFNLSSRISWQDLKDKMRKGGEVTYVEAHTSRKNEAIVDFATLEDLERVFRRYQNYEMNGRKIELVKDIQRSKSRSKDKRNSRSGSRDSRSGTIGSTNSVKQRSGSRDSRSGTIGSTNSVKQIPAKFNRSGSREKSELRSPEKNIDIDDQDVKRSRKRSHSGSSHESGEKSNKQVKRQSSSPSPNRRHSRSCSNISLPENDEGISKSSKNLNLDCAENENTADTGV